MPIPYSGMHAILSRTPEEKRAKSRSGCKACKSRRIKCDETTPSCQQCTRRKLQCPGYAKRLTWSSKHEKLSSNINQPGIKTTAAKTPVPVATNAGHNQRGREFDIVRGLAFDAFNGTHRSDIGKSSAPLIYEYDEQLRVFDEQFGYDPSILSESPTSPWICSTQPDDFNVDYINESVEHSQQPPENIACVQLTHGRSTRAGKLPSLRALSPSPTCDFIFCNPSLALHYFGQVICKRLSTYDMISNPMRKITLARVHDSPLYNALLRYLLAAYLNKRVIAEQTQGVLKNAQNDTLFYLGQETEIALNQGNLGTSAIGELLLAVVMFGLTESWDGSNNTGIQHYRIANRLYDKASANMSPSDRWFFSETLIYWWTGLTFVINVDVEPLPNPPSPQIRTREFGTDEAVLPPQNLLPHPLTGISPQSYVLLGKVAALIHSQRTRALSTQFLTKSHIQQQEYFLRASYVLEEDLLSIQIPPASAILEIEDPNTSVYDLRNTAEAVRLAGLLLLYRCFPDLLCTRIAVDISQGIGSTEAWLRSLAMHVLNLLEQNGSDSGTRSVEQVLIVTIAGELRLPSRTLPGTSAAFTDVEKGGDWFGFGCSGPVLEGTAWLSDLPTLCTLHMGPCIGSSDDEVDANEDWEVQVREARSRLSKRLATVRDILPYRSVEQVQELIWEVWRRVDAKEDAFWMDVMTQNTWSFIMA